MTDILTAISTVGFPIVSFLICCYGLKYSFDKSLEQNKDSLDKLEKLTEAINNNTVTLTELVEEIKRGDNDAN